MLLSVWAAGTGVVITRHYCGGELVKVSAFSATAECGMEKMMSQKDCTRQSSHLIDHDSGQGPSGAEVCTHDSDLTQNDCCRDESLYCGALDPVRLLTFETPNPAQSAAAVVVTHCVAPVTTTDSDYYSGKYLHPPPQKDIALHVLFQSFLC